MTRLHDIDSDLKSAVRYNGEYDGLDLDKVEGVVAAVYGENDGADWYWLLKMKDGTYGLGQGGCDYTGWDCQSSFIFRPTKTLKQALKLTPELEGWWGRKISTILQKQLDGVEAFGVVAGEDIL